MIFTGGDFIMSLLSSESINDSHGTISDEEHKTQNNSGWRDRLSLNIIMVGT